MTSFALRPATFHDDALIAENFRRMWADYDLDKLLSSEWLAETLRFIARARAGLEYKAFVAEVGSEPVGSVACQVFGGLYPAVFQADKRKYGYIWGVYVLPEHRNRGIAKALTNACTDYLRTIGCTRVLLHASPLGEPVYKRLGFEPSNELVLEL